MCDRRPGGGARLCEAYSTYTLDHYHVCDRRPGGGARLCEAIVHIHWIIIMCVIAVLGEVLGYVKQ